jgi:two-component system cell cycle sensor histidine kinase/response regulator CckA
MDHAVARVLVVEDDTVSRLLMVQILQEAGFEVLEAESGHEAMRLMIHPDHVDLLVSNVNRPWPDGIVMARHAQARQPPIPILFVTGPVGKQRLINVPGPYRTLPKPFNRAGLEAAVAAMMHDIPV